MVDGDRGTPEDNGAHRYIAEQENRILEAVYLLESAIIHLLEMTKGSYLPSSHLNENVRPSTGMAVTHMLKFFSNALQFSEVSSKEYFEEHYMKNEGTGKITEDIIESEFARLPFWAAANPRQKQEITSLINDITSLSADTDRRRRNISHYLQQLAHG